MALWLSFFSFSNAQVPVESTPNLIQPYGWQGCLTQHAGTIWGGISGGPCPVQRSDDGAILWSYGTGTLSQTIAVNQALIGTGIQVRGYNYYWQIKNANAGGNQSQPYDPLTITTNLYDSSNKTVLENKTHDYSYRINDWTIFSGSEEYKNKYSLSSVGNFSVTMTSRDVGYWAGYYGPEIRNIHVSLRYSFDICTANPLSSPECPGYAQAYLEQQCSINSLYSPQCPGYAQAYLQQQCSINSLYNASCPGYSQAYFQYQCTANPLYNIQCPGYQQALFTKTCNENPLSDTKCPLYQQAYLNQQCTMNPLFSTSCPLYQQAFFNQQCTVNPLYNTGCPGYAEAFRNKQIADACAANPQSNPSCKGYATPQITSTTTVSTATLSTIVPSVILPGSDPVASITQPKVVDDPVVNQIIEKSPQKTESTSQVTPQAPTQQRAGIQQQPQRQQQSRTQQNISRANVSSQPRVGTSEEKKDEDKLAAIATVPGFSDYENARLPDLPFYKVEDIYKRVTLPDNARAQRLLNQRSDRLHREMVDEQYRK